MKVGADDSGPVAGMSRRAEHRAQQCENALWFLLNLPGVQEAIERVDPDAVSWQLVPLSRPRLRRLSTDTSSSNVSRPRRLFPHPPRPPPVIPTPFPATPTHR